MFKDCELNLFNNLELNEEVCSKLRISKAGKYELLSIIDNSKRVLKQEDNHVVIAESLAVKKEILNDSSNKDNYYYINMKTYIILINTKTLYGILCDGKLISIYDNKIIRDTKLKLATIHGFSAVMDDVTESHEILASINSQTESGSDYQKLKSFNRHSIDYYS